MKDRFAVLCVSVCCALWAPASSACLAHLMQSNPEEFSRVYRQMMQTSGLYSAPRKTFQMKHPVTAVVPIENEATLAVHYQRPAESTDVTLSLAGIGDVEPLDNDVWLTESDGVLNLRFKLNGHGRNNALVLTMSGYHDGALVTETSKVYLLGKRKSTTAENTH